MRLASGRRWAVPGRTGPRRARPRAEPERLVQRLHGVRHPLGVDHARDLDRGGGDHLDVDARSPSVREHLRRDAGMAAAFPPRPRDTFPIASSATSSPSPARPRAGSSASRAARRSSRGTVNEISARWSADTGSFWMIMSTFTLASASALKIAPGDARLVGHARERDARVVGGVGDGCDQGAFHRLLLGHDEGTGPVLEARAAVDAHAVVARVLDRAQLQHLRARGRHLEHLLERDDRQLARVRHDAAGRPMKTPSTSV